VKQDATRLLQYCNWKLTKQNGTTWRKKLWGAKARLGASVPQDGWPT